MKRIGIVAVVALVALVSAVALAATVYRGTMIIRAEMGQTAANTKLLKIQNYSGTEVASLDTEGDLIGVKGTFSGNVYGTVEMITTTAATTAQTVTSLTAANSGAVVVNLGTGSTTTVSLPAAAAGLHYCVIEGGDAAGELLVNPASGDAIVMKTTAAGTAVAPAAGTGVKNSAGSNVRSDSACFVAVDGTTWLAVSQTGTWASQ